MKRKYQFTNAIMFAVVMRDRELCRGLLQVVLPEREIREVRLHEEYLEPEKLLIADVDAKKVRLDVLFGDSTAWYDVEMQVADEGDLPKRTRYSHAAVDVTDLKPGDEYNLLKPCYVIFLCLFDFFGLDEPVYRFEMYDSEKRLPLGDESYTIVLNSRVSDAVDVPQALRELFRYMNEAVVPEENAFLEQLDRSVEEWNTGERRRMLMTLEQEMLIREKKIQKEAEAKGREEQKKQMRALCVQMNKASRMDDYIAAMESDDSAWIDKLLEEYGLAE